MPGPIFSLEWPNANSQRKYPLAPDATAIDESASFTIPEDFLLDLIIPVRVDTDIEPDLFYLRSITATGLGFSITIAYDDGTSDPPIVGTAIIPRSLHTEGRSYAIPGVDAYDDTIGTVVVGLLDSALQQPAGTYTFDYAGGKLDPHAIRPNIRSIGSVRVVNNSEYSDRIYGAIEFVAGTNIRITPILIEGQDPQIRFDAVNGEGLTADCLCTQDVSEATCIRFINNIPGDSVGNFNLVGNTCVTIESITNGLSISDSCSSPCCGCTELEKITEDLAKLGNGVITLQNFVNRQETQVTQFANVVLGSRLADNGCVDCG